jgi:hypothetical protein
MRRNNCSIQRVEEFAAEGGGLTAMINGEEVLCGGASFMHLWSFGAAEAGLKKLRFCFVSGVLTGFSPLNTRPSLPSRRAGKPAA